MKCDHPFIRALVPVNFSVETPPYRKCQWMFSIILVLELVVINSIPERGTRVHLLSLFDTLAIINKPFDGGTVIGSVFPLNLIVLPLKMESNHG